MNGFKRMMFHTKVFFPVCMICQCDLVSVFKGNWMKSLGFSNQEKRRDIMSASFL